MTDPGRAALRRRLRAQRATVAGDPERDEARFAHLAQVLAAPSGEPVRRVAAYVSMPGEPSTALLLARLTCEVLLPVLLADDDLGWALWAGELVAGRRGTSHPPGELTPLATADLVLAPALAIDRSGTRLGQGGGSYDRALPRRRPGVRVFAWLNDEDMVDDLPRAPWDVPVDGAITPGGVVFASG